MTTPLQPLTLLLDHNERERDAALAAHRRAETASAAAAAQSAQLHDYRRDYETRWSQHLARGTDQIELLRCSHSFMARLSDAVEQQAAIAAHATAQSARAFAALQALEMRCASVRKLIERRLNDERLAGTRREQKQSDEYAARAAWRRLAVDRQAGWA